MLGVFGRFFPEQFKAVTGMTTDEFKKAYNPEDEAFCDRMEKRYNKFVAAHPAAHAQANAYMRQGMSQESFSGAGAPEKTKNPTKLERTQKE